MVNVPPHFAPFEPETSVVDGPQGILKHPLHIEFILTSYFHQLRQAKNRPEDSWCSVSGPVRCHHRPVT